MMDGYYLICPNLECDQNLITEEEQYVFLDVREDPLHRDVIKFRCKACGQIGESFAYLKMPE